MHKSFCVILYIFSVLTQNAWFSIQFGMDELHIGLMFMIIAGGYLLSALIVGPLSDKFVSLDICKKSMQLCHKFKFNRGRGNSSYVDLYSLVYRYSLWDQPRSFQHR